MSSDSPKPAPLRLGTGMPRALDFAGRQRWSVWAWSALALAALLGLLALAGAWQWWQQAQQVGALNDQLARLAPLRSAAAQGPTLDPVSERDALQTAAELGVSWGPLLAHLAQGAQRDVALTQLEPDARAGTLLISGQAATPEAALAYARKLGEGRVLADVQLLSHEQADKARRLPTQFRLSARWQRQEP